MGLSWKCLMVVVVQLLVSQGLFGTARRLLASCPRPGSNIPPYCTCSSSSARIQCDFQNKEEVMLTQELLEPYNNMSVTAVYVRVANASSVFVSSDFIVKWSETASSAFDIWHSGEIILQSTPRPPNNTRERAGTFSGVGIVNCRIKELPPSFLRDRTRGTLRIKQSKVGVFRAGFFNNVKELRYIVVQDSEVEEVEGSVAAEGYVTLSQRSVHSWNGLLLSNTTIGTLGPGAFNLTHKSDMEVMEVKNCRVSNIGEGALSASGDVQVTISGNAFKYLQKGAFKVNVTGSVIFNNNAMGAQGLEALGELGCHNASSIQNNTILVYTPVTPVSGQPSTPLHPSCGKPQLFMVLSPARTILSVEDTRVAWVLGATVAVVAMVMVVSVAWVFRRRRPIWSVSRFPHLFTGRSHETSLENLPRNIELNPPHEGEDPEEGTSVKDLDMTCEPQEEYRQALLDPNSVDQISVQSCDETPSDASCNQHSFATFPDEDLT